MQQNNTFIGFVSGIVGGAGSFILNIQVAFLTDMATAILTALLCGAAGVAGKEGYVAIRAYIKKQRSGIKG